MYEQRLKMSRDMEKTKENLLKKFNLLMNSRKKRNKFEIMKKLFGEDYIENNHNENTFSLNTSKAKSMKRIKIKKNNIDNDNNNKGDFEFLTNIGTINNNKNNEVNKNNNKYDEREENKNTSYLKDNKKEETFIDNSIKEENLST